MFIQNQINHLPNHFEIIKNELSNASEILLIVSYVRNNGVDDIYEIIKNKKVKLLCSFDMGITQLEAIKKLLYIKDVEIKVYKSREGTFHSKVWLFKQNNNWHSIIGSANLTSAALHRNVEASVLIRQDENTEIVTNSIMFFNYLWENEKSISINKIEIEQLIKQSANRNTLKHQITKKNKNILPVIFDFVKNWIDIDKNLTTSKMLSSLWRGWYIIPDQGYIGDLLIKELISYVRYIHSIGGEINLNKNNNEYNGLLDLFVQNRRYNIAELKLSPHALFIRQAKNYLLKFEWLMHPIKKNNKLNKKKLILTKLGNDIVNCKDLNSVRIVFSDYFFNYYVNGLQILPFTLKVIENTDNYISLDEVSMFLIHSYKEEDLSLIVNLIKNYRKLTQKEKKIFIKKYRKYFDKIKGKTGKNVYGNYKKKVKHTISVLGWTNYLKYDDKFTLKLIGK